MRAWILLLIALVAGAALNSCAIAATSGLFALSGFYGRMDRDAPHRPLGAALRCIGAGLAFIVCATALAVMAAGTALDWWQPTGRGATLIGSLRQGTSKSETSGIQRETHAHPGSAVTPYIDLVPSRTNITGEFHGPSSLSTRRTTRYAVRAAQTRR